MINLEYDIAPDTGAFLWRAAFSRKTGLTEGETLGRFEATLAPTAATGLAEYQRICGFPESDTLPLSFPQVVAAPLHLAIFTHPSFPLPAMGLVHVASRIVQHRPIQAGEAMAIRCTIEGHRPARRGVEADLITEVSVNGDLVWESVTTVLSRAGKGDGKKTAAPPVPDPTPTRSATWSLATDLGRRYSKVAGDRNPIHLWPITAKLFGFKRHIIHGMWLLARAVAELDSDVGTGPVELTVSFKRPVFLPGRAIFSSGQHEGGFAFQLADPERGKLHLHGVVRPLQQGS